MPKLKENEDSLGLKDAKLLLVYGSQKLWSYTNKYTDNTSYACTKGKFMITHTDFILSVNNRLLWDKPEEFTPTFRLYVTEYFAKHNLFN